MIMMAGIRLIPPLIANLSRFTGTTALSLTSSARTIDVLTLQCLSPVKNSGHGHPGVFHLLIALPTTRPGILQHCCQDIINAAVMGRRRELYGGALGSSVLASVLYRRIIC